MSPKYLVMLVFVVASFWPQRSVANKKVQRYSEWTPWSRCRNCWQSRLRICVSPECDGSRMYEERPCDRSRCLRQRQLKAVDRRLHIVKEATKDDSPMRTKGLRSQKREWSKWSRWKECSSDCKTERYKVCRNANRCRKKRKSETAYCYVKQTNCEMFVLQLLHAMDVGANRYQDVSQYEYNTPKRHKVHDKGKKKCGRTQDNSMLKILGGRNARRNKWPWHVAILNKYEEVFCSGTLIAPRWVLTANHCLRQHLIVRLNEYDTHRLDPQEVQFVVKSFSHPNFNHSTVDNDIALLRLPKAVDTPIACLPRHKPRVADYCSIMGWGKVNTSDESGWPILQEAQIPIVNNATCTRAYRQYLITKNMFCAGYPNGKVDTCAGDSGGGLTCKERRGGRYFVQGITSFGDGCGVKNKYGIYTNVVNYKRWINEVMRRYS